MTSRVWTNILRRGLAVCRVRFHSVTKILDIRASLSTLASLKARWLPTGDRLGLSPPVAAFSAWRTMKIVD